MLIADKKNSAHIYKYDEKRNDINYIGGDECGKSVIKADWLNDTDVYTLNDDKTLTLFSMKERKYFILDDNYKTIIEKQSPIPIISESYFNYARF